MFPAYAALAEKKSIKLKEADLRVIKSIYQRVMALLDSTLEGAAGAAGAAGTAGTAGAAPNYKATAGAAAAAVAANRRGFNISNIMPKYKPRHPVFKLMPKPNFQVDPVFKESLTLFSELSSNLNSFKGLPAYVARDEAPHLALKGSNPFSPQEYSLASDQKDLKKNPIFSLPDPYNLASEKIFKLSGWQGVLGYAAQRLTANAAAEGDRSEVENADTTPVKKKKKHGLNTEILDFVKSLKNKLTDGFVDSFQKYDLYHK